MLRWSNIYRYPRTPVPGGEGKLPHFVIMSSYARAGTTYHVILSASVLILCFFSTNDTAYSTVSNKIGQTLKLVSK